MKPGAAVIATASGYECLAITLGYWPTITALVRRLPHRHRAAVCGAFSSWLFFHMLREVVEAKS